MEPMNINTVSPAKMAQSRVLARLANLHHGCVVFVRKLGHCPDQEDIPEGQRCHTNRAHRQVSGDNLCFRRAVCNRRLLLGVSLNGKEGVWPRKTKEGTRGAAPTALAAREVRVRVQMAANGVLSIPNPSNFSQVQHTLNIAHHAMQHRVAMRIPFCHKTCKSSDPMKQIVTT